MQFENFYQNTIWQTLNIFDDLAGTDFAQKRDVFVMWPLRKKSTLEITMYFSWQQKQERENKTEGKIRLTLDY